MVIYCISGKINMGLLSLKKYCYSLPLLLRTDDYKVMFFLQYSTLTSISHSMRPTLGANAVATNNLQRITLKKLYVQKKKSTFTN